MTLVTFIIPFAPYHKDIVQTAIECVKAQSIPCDYIAVEDSERHGAGWARNVGIQRATTPFVAFLDADDTITADYAETCLKAWQAGRYVYTDWLEGDDIKQAPDPCHVFVPNQGRTNIITHHLVNVLMPRRMAVRVGGFDTTMTGGEDTEFFARVRNCGICGIRVNKPLVSYSALGVRSHAFVTSINYHHVMNTIAKRYGGNITMACCGDYKPNKTIAVNEEFAGALLVRPSWGGNMPYRGRATGNLYPRSSRSSLLWVDASDFEADNRLELVPTEEPDLTPYEFEELGAVLFPPQPFSATTTIADIRLLNPFKRQTPH
jgi:hypothetical protein